MATHLTAFSLLRRRCCKYFRVKQLQIETLAVQTLTPPPPSLHSHQPELRVHTDSQPVNRFINGDFVHERELGLPRLITVSVQRRKKKGGGDKRVVELHPEAPSQQRSTTTSSRRIYSDADSTSCVQIL